MNRRYIGAIALIGAALFVAGCDDTQPTADQKIQAKQEQSQQEAVAETGLPNTPNFTELKNVKYLYELRDQKLLTYSYVIDMNGNLHHVCNSIGYGLPYGVQYSNPEKAIHPYQGVYYNLPQAEPNGLYMPPTAEGTWVLCSDPSKKQGFQPMYVEPRVIVSPWKLHSISEWAVAEPETKTK